MKNFSTVGARLVIAASLSALAVPAAQAASCDFRADAPDQHTVVKGDTLWDIAGRFLEAPWCWGQVWGMNREEIKNPHWIYPGQIVYFDRVAGRLRLGNQIGANSGNGDGADPGITRLKPQLRTEALGRDAVPSIPSSVIEPFLSQPMIVEASEMAGAAQIIATQEGRVSLGKDDKAYVRGNLRGGTAFQVFRPGTPLRDPGTKAIIGYEAFYLGTLKLKAEAKSGADVHTFTVASSKQEMAVGDFLMPAPPTPLRNYSPHPPERPVDARVVSIYGGVDAAGQNQVVAINRGKIDGLDLGSVLQLYRYGSTVPDPTVKKAWHGMNKATVKLPDEVYGTLFVFHVFNKISYGLIMQVTEPVVVGDVAKSPE